MLNENDDFAEDGYNEDEDDGHVGGDEEGRDVMSPDVDVVSNVLPPPEKKKQMQCF